MSQVKKVKFDPLNYNTEIIEEPDLDEMNNDLDLDTIKASKTKPKGLKEFDSEGSEEEELGQQPIKYELSVSEEDETEGSLNNEEDIDERNDILIEPFNLKGDKEEGTFDSEGFFTRNPDEDAEQDRWMSNFTRSDILKARKAHEEREKFLKQQQQQKQQKSQGSARELYEELVGLLTEEENDLSVQQVISKLNKPKESNYQFGGRAPPMNKNRLKKLAKEQHSQLLQLSTCTLMTEEEKEKLDRITEIVDALMDLGYFGVYEETRREILAKLK